MYFLFYCSHELKSTSLMPSNPISLTSQQFTNNSSVYSKSTAPRAPTSTHMCSVLEVPMHPAVSSVATSTDIPRRPPNVSKIGGSARSSISSDALVPAPVQPSRATPSVPTSRLTISNATSSSLQPLNAPLSPLMSSTIGPETPSNVAKIGGSTRSSMSSAASQNGHSPHPHARLNVVFDGTQSLPGASELEGN